MNCEHCGFSCTAQGTDMTMEIFNKACKISEDLGKYITIGGGEPTLHPLFWNMLGTATMYSEEVPYIITNGSITNRALKLNRLAIDGVIGAELSQDNYHDVIDQKVINAFTKRKAIRNVGERIVSIGRALNWGTIDDACICEGLLIDPKGNIWACGCKTISFGTVFDPKIPECFDYLWGNECPTIYKNNIDIDDLDDLYATYKEEDLCISFPTFLGMTDEDYSDFLKLKVA